MKKILLLVCTYPRKNDKTPQVFMRMCKSLFQDFSTIRKSMPNIIFELLIVGDDYSNINQDFRPILEHIGIKYTIVNINQNNALRHMNANKQLKWHHACTRSLIYGFKFSLQKKFDYIITFSDDDYYNSNYFSLINEAINKNSEAELIFGLGNYKNKIIMPRKRNKILTDNSPTSCDTIASGIVFKSKNIIFISDIIQLLETRWNKVIKNLDYPDSPNDAIMWDYLKPKFNNNVYRSFLIPSVIVYHDTEQTIFDNI